MVFLALLGAIFGVILAEYLIYKKYGYSGLSYSVSFGSDEVLRAMTFTFLRRSPTAEGFLCPM